MKKLTFWIIILLMSSFNFVHSNDEMANVSIQSVPGFPCGEAGYSLGVSACYAGTIGDYLVIAGGCNFPEPGRKKYYSGIYAAKAGGDSLEWKCVGNLPEPAAYGATVCSGDSIILIGGNNNDRSLRTVVSVHLNTTKGKAEVKVLPLLPCTMDNMAAAYTEGHIFVMGGNQDGQPSSRMWHLNMNAGDGWEFESSMPGLPRVQPVSVACRNKVYVWGGFYSQGENSSVATYGISYNLSTHAWKTLDAPVDSCGNQLTLSGGSAALSDQIICTGGVNREIFLDAISGRYLLVRQADYMHQDISWYRFNGHLLVYDPVREMWQEHPHYDQRLARAGAQLVAVCNILYYIGGELKPGVRTPKILRISND